MNCQKCVDLKQGFGDRYRIVKDPCYFAEHGKNAYVDDPWYDQIPCRYGHICPYGDELLMVCTNTRGAICTKLSKIQGLSVVQDGSDGINAIFHVSRFSDVAKIIKPKSKRRLSPAQKKKLIEAGRKSRFAAGAGAVSDSAGRAQAA